MLWEFQMREYPHLKFPQPLLEEFEEKEEMEKRETLSSLLHLLRASVSPW